MTDELVIPKKSSQIYRDFFERDAETVARDLLGRVMVQERPKKSSLYVQLSEIATYEGIVGDDLEEFQKKHSNLFYGPGVLGVSTAYGKHMIDIGTKDLCDSSCITLIAGYVFNRKGFRKHTQGPGNISRALDIDGSYDNVPINFGGLWIGGEPVNPDEILIRNKSNVPENCKGFFYFR